MRRFFSLSCLAAIPLLGDSLEAPLFQRGHEMKATDLPSGYNASARIDTQKTWEFFFSGSFIYWMPMQDGMEISVSNRAGAPAAPLVIVPNVGARVKDFHTHYKPGFKATFGMSLLHDNWTAYLQFTQLTAEQKSDAKRPNDSSFLFSLTTPSTVSLPEHSQDNRWGMHLHILDCNMDRAFYAGTALTLQPFIGLRMGKIEQHLGMRAVAFLSNANPIVVLHSSYRTHEWMMGPRAGVESRWLLGKGFRLFGTAAGALCYTQTRTRIKQGIATLSPEVLSVKDRQGEVKPNGEIDVGLGWGTYFNSHKTHFDIAASYDFNVFWNQNMMSALKDQLGFDAGSSPGNLYFHGLTAKAQFNF